MRLIPVAYREVSAEPGFRRLMSGLLASALGDGMSAVVIAWLALRLAPPGREGLVAAAAITAYTLPGALGAVLFVRWLGRADARTLVISSALLRAVSLGTAATLHLTGRLDPTGYVLLLALSSVLAAWGSAGTFTLISQLVRRDRRLAANSLVNTALQGSLVAGPPLAGVIVAVSDPGWALAFDAFTFAVLAVQVSRIRATAPVAAPADRQARHGFGVILRRPELLGVLAVTGVFYFLYGPVEVALPIYVNETSGSASLLGTYWAVFSVGFIIGGLAGGLITSRVRQWPIVVAVIAGWGAALLPFGLTDLSWVTIAAFGLGGLIYGPYPAFLMTLFQNAAEPAELPAVLAAKSAVTTSVVPIGVALGGVLSTILGPAGTMFASGAATIALAVGTALVLMVAARRVPAPMP